MGKGDAFRLVDGACQRRFFHVRLHFLVLDVEIAEYELRGGVLWQLDGIAEDNQAIVAPEGDDSLSGLQPCRGIELVGQQPLFFRPVQECPFPEVEAHQLIVRADNEFVGMRAGQDTEDVV